ncbi:MAG: DNA polymerase IV [Myxococcota bacterium]
MTDWTDNRVIFHVDMDAFYAAIEQRDNPELRGKPVIVGGSQKRGVVATCSYEAREYGVHSAMPGSKAARLCPDAIFVKVRMSHYAEVSRTIMQILGTFSPAVQQLSLDEAFLDMTGAERLFGTPAQMATKIKAAIEDQTQLTCSIGIATNKFLAKLASDLDKPDGVTVIPPGEERSYIAELDIRKIWGVGPKAGAKLRRLGFNTIGEIARASVEQLSEGLGHGYAKHIRALARGEDDRPVVSDTGRKSVGSERTLSENITGRGAVEKHLRRQIENVTRTLRKKEIKAGGVRVKVRYDGTFELATRQGSLPTPADDSMTLVKTAFSLLDTLDLDRPIRLVGAAAFDLRESSAAAQLDMFATDKATERSELERTIDEIEDRFGMRIVRGRDIEDDGERSSGLPDEAAQEGGRGHDSKDRE